MSEAADTQSNITHSALCDGMNGVGVRIESQFVRGFSGMQMVGNISESLRDSRERAKTALESLGVHLPPQKLVMSITPAEIKKSGAQFDLAIAVNLLLLMSKSSKTPYRNSEHYVYVAGLSLTGELLGVKGIISYAIAAISEGFQGIVIATDNAADLAILKGMPNGRFDDLEILAFTNLQEVNHWLKGKQDGLCITADSLPCNPDVGDADVLSSGRQGGGRAGVQVAELTDTVKRHRSHPLNFNDMVLDEKLYRVALCMAVGHHSLLLQGPPGTGKSMFASRVPSILPLLDSKVHLQALNISSSHSVNVSSQLLAGFPPFRSPHHSASPQGILGTTDQPGDIALAHGGVLFLDEIPEFRRDIIEALREPLETGEIHISRAKAKSKWPANLILIAAANNCPCGYWGSKKKTCSCAINSIISYRRKLSGPIVDRIDMHINVTEHKDDPSLLLDLAGSDDDQTTHMRECVDASLSFALQRNRKLGLS
ncbi:MAG: ATP-binding protein, partial [Pseudomonadota bacterium]|nr:ATP-binding protein [Pseudomonadota bacterium]